MQAIYRKIWHFQRIISIQIPQKGAGVGTALKLINHDKILNK